MTREDSRWTNHYGLSEEGRWGRMRGQMAASTTLPHIKASISPLRWAKDQLRTGGGGGERRGRREGEGGGGGGGGGRRGRREEGRGGGGGRRGEEEELARILWGFGADNDGASVEGGALWRV